MAKGFKVVSTPPKTDKKDDFDIAAAKEKLKGKSIVFCLPGRQVRVYRYRKIIVQWLTLLVVSA